MPISFGSVGDIISICLIVKDLVVALDESRGAANEYKGLRRELCNLERALLEVELLSRSSYSTIQLNALYATARKAALDCRYPVEQFLKKVKKYDHSLAGGSKSNNIFRDSAMKIKWQLFLKEDIARFRAEITAHSSSINMLLVTANVKIARDNHREISSRFDNTEKQWTDTNIAQSTVLAEVRDRLEANGQIIAMSNASINRLHDMFKLDWLRQLGTELKSFMQRIFTMNLYTYHAIIAIQKTISGGLQRSLNQEPFILEDAIGRLAPVHLQFINSWEAFESVLDLRFQDLQGHKKVKNKEYVLQEHSTRREVKREVPWESAFLPGQRIDMSLVFKSERRNTENASCPSCFTFSDKMQDSEVLCNGCGIWYQRLTEYIDPELSPVTPNISIHRKYVAQFGQPYFSDISLGSKCPSQFSTLSSSPKRKQEALTVAEDDISLFKRIRLISEEKRHNHKLTGPFLFCLRDHEICMLEINRQKMEEQNAQHEYQRLKTEVGELHPSTLASLGILTRLLRNGRKYNQAEELLQSLLWPNYELLISKNLENLRLLLADLMKVLVDQGKFEEANELWETSISRFRIALGESQAEALSELFNSAHPFHIRRKSVSVNEGVIGLVEPQHQVPCMATRVGSIETEQHLRSFQDSGFEKSFNIPSEENHWSFRDHGFGTYITYEDLFKANRGELQSESPINNTLAIYRNTFPDDSSSFLNT